jgi:hypothetical protein
MPGRSQRATTATAPLVTTTNPIASSEIGRMLRRNSRQDVKYAAAHKIGGRKTRKTRSGFKVTVGTPGMRLRINPPMTRRMG